MSEPEPRRSAGANDPEALKQTLRENLDELLTVLTRVAPDALDSRLDDDEWSVREVVLHVIHAERWLQPQLSELRWAVSEKPPPLIGGITLPDHDSDPDLNELRWAINAVREDTARLLDGLTAEELREPANVEVADDIIDFSFRTMLLTVADHQLFHVRQIERILEQ
jgi:uncharacterized damage-inducible protein DinB